MGCGGSKASDVAKDNAVIHRVLRKRSIAKSKRADQQVNVSKSNEKNPAEEDAKRSEKPAPEVTDVKDIVESNELKETEGIAVVADEGSLPGDAKLENLKAESIAVVADEGSLSEDAKSEKLKAEGIAVVADEGSLPEDAKSEKLISSSSPDQYFSSRKDESVEVVSVDGSENITSGTDQAGEDRKKDQDGEVTKQSTVGDEDDSSNKNEELPCSSADDEKQEEQAINEGAEEEEEKANETGPMDSQEPTVVEETIVDAPIEEDKEVTAADDVQEEAKA